MAISNTTLIAFKCGATLPSPEGGLRICGYEEQIGVGIHLGVIIIGHIVMTCPRCGNITALNNATVLVKPTPLSV